MRPPKYPSSTFLNEIRHLLLRSHCPLVRIGPSKIAAGAGTGVFAKDTASFQKNKVMCLYPGVYSPPIPRYVSVSDGSKYLAITRENVGENDKILTLNPGVSGGFLDGNALIDIDPETGKTTRLDENPSACGHFVNHRPGNLANVEVATFRWMDVWDNDFAKGEPSIETAQDKYFPCCNARRRTGPWYFDGLTENVVWFPAHNGLLSGAALCLNGHVDSGEELFLDYKLKKPYPKWAEGWYEAAG